MGRDPVVDILVVLLNRVVLLFKSWLMNLTVILCVDDVQVDSGYNTMWVGTASLDGLGSVCNGTLNINSSILQDEPFPFPRQAKVKVKAPVVQLTFCGSTKVLWLLLCNEKPLHSHSLHLVSSSTGYGVELQIHTII